VGDPEFKSQYHQKKKRKEGRKGERERGKERRREGGREGKKEGGKRELLIQGKTWRKFKCILLNLRCQSENVTYYMIPTI
jgi:hypothetical protein